MKINLVLLILSLLFSFPACSQTVPNFKSLSAVEFNKLLETKVVTLIDVRTPTEFSMGFIPGAVNVDVNSPEFVSRVKDLVSTKPVAIYCRTGRRSKLAADKLSGLGIEIYELKNGFLEWIQSGYQTSVNIKK